MVLERAEDLRRVLEGGAARGKSVRFLRRTRIEAIGAAEARGVTERIGVSLGNVETLVGEIVRGMK